ncbi:hypothetical protein BDW02DRAFT_601271 [Decorospora gaudefroyi]|uniref:Uncharacterized protein n=1 Tax=Decorospora gaudefroyi TaxID=184978 RepID=A0A6A5K0Q0_9PLEO|nr:hypothetical protein BDW02DRAFT_601271 [Decorospora gaudefroyi]
MLPIFLLLCLAVLGQNKSVVERQPLLPDTQQPTVESTATPPIQTSCSSSTVLSSDIDIDNTTYTDILITYPIYNIDSVLQNSILHTKDQFQICMECIQQAGVDTSTPSSPSMLLKDKIHAFCNTEAPNLYDLLTVLLDWLQATNPNPDSTPPFSAISTYADRFTSTSGMNSPSPSPPSAKTGHQNSDNDSEENAEIELPTQWLQQIPQNWPYTSYGIARHNQPGHTASLPLLDNSTTAAWVYAELRWNPRPLYTPPHASDASSLYQPLLEGWTPSFGLERNDAMTRTSTSVVITPILTDPLPTITVQLTSKRVTATVMLTTPPPVLIDTPVRPTLPQSELLSPIRLEAGDTARGGAVTGTGTVVGSGGGGASSVAVPVLEELWSEVQSMRSRLGERR